MPDAMDTGRIAADLIESAWGALADLDEMLRLYVRGDLKNPDVYKDDAKRWMKQIAEAVVVLRRESGPEFSEIKHAIENSDALEAMSRLFHWDDWEQLKRLLTEAPAGPQS